MLKNFILTALITMSFCAPTNAAYIPVQNNFDPSVLTFSPDTMVTTYQDSEIEINISNPIYQSFFADIKGLPFYNKLIDSSFTQVIRLSALTTKNATYDYYVCVGANLSFKNKTTSPIYIDLNNSAITIGSYYGKPLLENIRFSESAQADLPPLIIMPNQTIEKNLYRNDYIYYNQRSVFDFNTQGWVIKKEDLYLSKNIFGDGNFVFTTGVDKKRIIPMQFNLEIDEQAVMPFIESKEQQGLEKFKTKMIKKMNKK